jgi:hypothetical protein
MSRAAAADVGAAAHRDDAPGHDVADGDRLQHGRLTAHPLLDGGIEDHLSQVAIHHDTDGAAAAIDDRQVPELPRPHQLRRAAHERVRMHGDDRLRHVVLDADGSPAIRASICSAWRPG